MLKGERRLQIVITLLKVIEVVGPQIMPFSNLFALVYDNPWITLQFVSTVTTSESLPNLPNNPSPKSTLNPHGQNASPQNSISIISLHIHPQTLPCTYLLPSTTTWSLHHSPLHHNPITAAKLKHIKSGITAAWQSQSKQAEFFQSWSISRPYD